MFRELPTSLETCCRSSCCCSYVGYCCCCSSSSLLVVHPGKSLNYFSLRLQCCRKFALLSRSAAKEFANSVRLCRNIEKFVDERVEVEQARRQSFRNSLQTVSCSVMKGALLRFSFSRACHSLCTMYICVCAGLRHLLLPAPGFQLLQFSFVKSRKVLSLSAQKDAARRVCELISALRMHLRWTRMESGQR